MDLLLKVERSGDVPVYRHIARQLREAIIAGHLEPGVRLPSSRDLAAHLGVSRNTIVNAYEELLADEYLEGRHGSGTYVSSRLPHLPAGGEIPAVIGESRGTERKLAAWAARVASCHPPEPSAVGPLQYDFRPGSGAWEAFPWSLWRRILAREWQRMGAVGVGYGDPAGYRPLRESVAKYLARSRGVQCGAEQVVVVNGTQQALDLLARLWLDKEQAVVLEDPGYPPAHRLFAAHGARLLPVGVDEQGLLVDELPERGARAALVSPSHQFPTGATMSLGRRLALLAWAADRGVLLLEDDYDGDLPGEGRLIPALQGLDRSGSVVYLGTFSNVLFPGLRVGYAILPPDLVAPFAASKDLADRQTPILEQRVVAAFLAEGHFERHIRRMRDFYRVRRDALLDAIREHLPGRVDLAPSSGGLHILVWLRADVDENELVLRAAEIGVGVYPAGQCFLRQHDTPGLVLGFGGMDERRVGEGISRLADLVKS
ncbi:MAG: PLP-dependent aminotransferase family protein [Chloroflexi bacterium]|nr:PLP-dependent aminotransferase family protein [Chloroflexota bacterium]